eukprot:14091647-Alexandrium_andersonii.AAC.1
MIPWGPPERTPSRTSGVRGSWRRASRGATTRRRSCAPRPPPRPRRTAEVGRPRRDQQPESGERQ